MASAEKNLEQMLLVTADAAEEAGQMPLAQALRAAAQARPNVQLAVLERRDVKGAPPYGRWRIVPIGPPVEGLAPPRHVHAEGLVCSRCGSELYYHDPLGLHDRGIAVMCPDCHLILGPRGWEPVVPGEPWPISPEEVRQRVVGMSLEAAERFGSPFPMLGRTTSAAHQLMAYCGGDTLSVAPDGSVRIWREADPSSWVEIAPEAAREAARAASDGRPFDPRLPTLVDYTESPAPAPTLGERYGLLDEATDDRQ